MPDIRELSSRIYDQTENKANWSEHDTPHAVALMIREESDELVEAIENDGDPFEVGSEIADVLYLALKLCAELGFNPDELIEMKMLRNDMKYPTDVNSNSGGYEEAVKKSKLMWKAMGGDKAFYHAYEVLIGELDGDSVADSKVEHYEEPDERRTEVVVFQKSDVD